MANWQQDFLRGSLGSTSKIMTAMGVDRATQECSGVQQTSNQQQSLAMSSSRRAGALLRSAGLLHRGEALQQVRIWALHHLQMLMRVSPCESTTDAMRSRVPRAACHRAPGCHSRPQARPGTCMGLVLKRMRAAMQVPVSALPCTS